MKAILHKLVWLAGFCWLAGTLNVHGQQAARPGISLIARNYGDSVVLRWAPNNPLVWQYCNRVGYQLTRFRIGQGGKIDSLMVPQRVNLNSAPLKPLPLDDWEPLVQGNDMAAVAAQSLYGSEFELTDPSDDIVTFLSQAQEMENRFGFGLFAADQSVPVAKAMGLRFTDVNTKPGDVYIYVVHPMQPNKKLPIDTGSVFLNTREFRKLPPPIDFEVSWGDGAALLKWNVFYNQRIYTSYFIERSNDNGKTFTRQKLPVIDTNPDGGSKDDRYMYHTDSLPQNFKRYVYRVVGRTPFGDAGPPSDTVGGVGSPTASRTNAVIERGDVLQDGRVVLSWRYPNQDDNYIKGFKVERATKTQGPYTEISDMLLPDRRNFTDAAPRFNNYYVVKAYTDGGKVANSFPYYVQLEDSIPPVAPVNLKGSIDGTGKVTLNWNPNQEEDIHGYRVYMANSPTEEFTQVTSRSVERPTFSHSININTLTKRVYYKVLALDHFYNPSPFSKMLVLERPDKIAPAPPAFTQVMATDSGNYVQWVHSLSNDVAQHVLMRGTQTDSAKIIWQGADSTFFDNNVVPGTLYTYRLMARDSSGLSSPAVQAMLSAALPKQAPPIDDVRYKIDRDKRQIIIGWKYKAEQISNYVLFRSVNQGPMRTYKTLNAATFIFTDKNLAAGSVYEYQLKAILKSGAQSPLSKPITVNY